MSAASASSSTSSSTAILKSWVPVEPNSDFPIQNLPYGVFSTSTQPDHHIGVAIGAHILDLHTLASYGLFAALPSLSHGDVFKQPTLNAFMALPRAQWVEARKLLTHLLTDSTATLRDNEHLRSPLALVPQSTATMHLPCVIGDYTDFYASRNHASNIGKHVARRRPTPCNPTTSTCPSATTAAPPPSSPPTLPSHRPRGQTTPDDSTPARPHSLHECWTSSWR